MIIPHIFKASCIVESNNVETDPKKNSNFSHTLTAISPCYLIFNSNICYGYFSNEELIANNGKIYLVAQISDSIDTFSTSLNYYFDALHFFLTKEEAQTFVNDLYIYVNAVSERYELMRQARVKKNTETVFKLDEKAFCDGRIELSNNNDDCSKFIYFEKNGFPIFLDNIKTTSMIENTGTFTIYEYQIPLYEINTFDPFDEEKSKITLKLNKDPFFE